MGGLPRDWSLGEDQTTMLRSQHLGPNTLIPHYLNPAYLETIQFAFLGVAMFLHIIYVPLHRLIIIAKTQ
jgi:hypothetical protein